MERKKKWTSPQSIIIMTIVLLIFVYIGVDFFRVKPQIQNQLKEVKLEYVELSGFLDKKIPEIDSTLKVQASQISEQEADINVLNTKIKDLTIPEE